MRVVPLIGRRRRSRLGDGFANNAFAVNPRVICRRPIIDAVVVRLNVFGGAAVAPWITPFILRQPNLSQSNHASHDANDK
jgi:hypothetical protein